MEQADDEDDDDDDGDLNWVRWEIKMHAIEFHYIFLHFWLQPCLRTAENLFLRSLAVAVKIRVSENNNKRNGE